MKNITTFLITSLMLTACCNHNENPFLAEWDTPYGLPPFDQIEEAHYLPAIREGIAQHEAEIAAIVADTVASSPCAGRRRPVTSTTSANSPGSTVTSLRPAAFACASVKVISAEWPAWSSAS